MSNIGRKVRIYNYFTGHINNGKIGTVIDDHSSIYTVKLENDDIIYPNSPSRENAQCEFIDDYKLENISNGKYCIHCPTKPLAREVLEILEMKRYIWYNGLKPTQRLNWETHCENTGYRLFGDCINFNNIISYKYDNYTIIPAEEFIKQNTQSEQMNSEFIVDGPKSLKMAFLQELKDKIFNPISNESEKSIINGIGINVKVDTKKFAANTYNFQVKYTLPQDWDKAIKALEDNEFKVGQYIVALNKSNGYTPGNLYRIKKINDDPKRMYCNDIFTELDDDGSEDNGWHRSNFRKATSEEISKWLNRVKIFHIGDNKKEVKISRKGIFVEDKVIPKMTIENIISKMTQQGNVYDWKIYFPKVDIGCCNNITVEELKKILSIYDELQK
jgi:hypothetical protein